MLQYHNQRRDDYLFTQQITLRVADIDINNHVNQSVYYEFFDTTFLAYLEECRQGLEIDEDFTCVCVENGCQYRREVTFNSAVEVALTVGRVGTTSVHFDLAVFTEGQNEPNVIAYFVVVFVDKKSHRPVAIPAALKERLKSTFATP